MDDGEEEEGEVERKKRREISGDVNLHRIKNLKKEFQSEIEEKKVSLKYS